MRTRRRCGRRKLSTSVEEQPSTECSSGREASVHGNQTDARPNPRFRKGRLVRRESERGRHSMNISINDKILYFGAGCGLGLALGALFAPQSGREMRQNLSSKMDDLSHKVQDKIESS